MAISGVGGTSSEAEAHCSVSEHKHLDPLSLFSKSVMFSIYMNLRF